MKTKGFRSRLLRKYRLTIHNENKLENVLGFYISPLWVILSLFFSFLLVAGVVYLIIAFTPVKNLLMENNVPVVDKQKLIEINLRMDSIMNENTKLTQYTQNIRAIIKGEVANDSIKNSPLPLNTDSIDVSASPLEKQFTAAWEEREQYNITSQVSNVAELQGLGLFRPTQGRIVRDFDEEDGHYGVDIEETPNENILATNDGKVVMSDYTANGGYTIVLQHRENMISVYRNCYRLLKNVGDEVEKGEAIGTLGGDINENAENEKKFLHFEIWHRGKPLDPNTYIAF
ncbi:MAG: M23 family metallopeptidase [Bacteroidaceae bacterium]|nr:M23 family metallopeptidase [Bacteroidaceae bacterium]